MNIKKLAIIIALGVLFLLLVFFGFSVFMNKTYKPGIKDLSKKNIGIFYCSYGDDGVKGVVDVIASKLKAEKIEIKPAVAYPQDQTAFIERIKQENFDITNVALDNELIDIRQYKLIILGSPVIEDKPCPVLQRFVIDNQSRFDKKPVSVLVLYKDGQSPRNTVEFFNYKLYGAVVKPSFITTQKDKNQLDYEVNLWFDLMEFKREELR